MGSMNRRPNSTNFVGFVRMCIFQDGTRVAAAASTTVSKSGELSYKIPRSSDLIPGEVRGEIDFR